MLLQGITVADFSRVLAGPLCTQMLGDHGARVIKVEEPQQGDETRRWGPPFLGEVSAYFLSVNRNKESLALDLKRGGEVAARLVRQADVVVDNFLPSQREQLGLGKVRELNPRAVHCIISGHDSDTADAAVPGYDLLAQAGSGLMAITGEPEGDPMKVGVALADVLTAHYAFGAICSALAARERTGDGATLEISLFAAALTSLVNVAQSALVTGNEARRYGNEHASIVPYQLFHARDRAFVVGAGTDRHYRALCELVLEQPALARDRRFATNAARVKHRAKLIPILEAAFRERTARQWVTRCRTAGVPAELVRGVRDALRSASAAPLIATLDQEEAGRYGALRNPLRVDGARLPIGTPPPSLGAHSDGILRELGYDRASVARMRADGIIASRTTSGRGSGRPRR